MCVRLLIQRQNANRSGQSNCLRWLDSAVRCHYCKYMRIRPFIYSKLRQAKCNAYKTSQRDKSGRNRLKVENRVNIRVIEYIDFLHFSTLHFSSHLSFWMFELSLAAVMHTHEKYKCHVLFKINEMTIVINVLWAHHSCIYQNGETIPVCKQLT